jgi:hypothetical protein
MDFLHLILNPEIIGTGFYIFVLTNNQSKLKPSLSIGLLILGTGLICASLKKLKFTLYSQKNKKIMPSEKDNYIRTINYTFDIFGNYIKGIMIGFIITNTTRKFEKTYNRFFNTLMDYD